MKAFYKKDTSEGTIYVRFAGVPSEFTRAELKKVGFRYNSRSGKWIAPLDSDSSKAAYEAVMRENEALPDDEPVDKIAVISCGEEKSKTLPIEPDPPKSVAKPDQVSGGRAGSADFAWIPEGKQPNAQQRRVIENTEGPMLVIAGPGTGKTATVVNRVVHLVADKDVDPSEIMIVTYTVKAAKELVSRIAEAFSKLESPTNLDQMRVGTFHALCFEILQEYARSTGVKNANVIDSFDEAYQIMKRWKGFKDLDKRGLLKGRFGKLHGYSLAKEVAATYCAIVEGQIDLNCVIPKVEDANMRDALDAISEYIDKFRNRSELTFADIQAETLKLLEGNNDVLKDLQSKVRYIIVDEYQDANGIQEKLVKMIAGTRGNVCAVGDDDQSLYRFRGADVENILHFPMLFEDCETVKLEMNYRSRKGIVDFCNRWMNETHFGENGSEGFGWGDARLEKTIMSYRDKDDDGPVSVFSCTGEDEDDWHESVYQLIERLKSCPTYSGPNQIAFICNSVGNAKIQSLINYLRVEKGIDVYAPRARLFSNQKEIRLAIGGLIACFEKCRYSPRLDVPGNWNSRGRSAQYVDWCSDCCSEAKDCNALKQWSDAKAEQFEKGAGLWEDHALLRLFSEMMSLEPFCSWLDADGRCDMRSTRAARNLAHLADLLDRFDAMKQAESESGKTNSADWLFKQFVESYFMQLSSTSDLSEAEDDEEYAPEGCVSFITAHQSKGLEYPVVVACSLFDEPGEYVESLPDIIRAAESKDEVHSRVERREFTPYYDFWRLYYTAFSRAQDLLVLTSMTEYETFQGTKPDPSKCFKKLYVELPDISKLDVANLQLSKIEPSKVMRTYSFTGDIDSYQKCPRRYRLCKMLGFPSISNQDEHFGDWIHRSIEEVHRRVLEDDSYTPTETDIEQIVSLTRGALELEGAKIKASDSDASTQVKNYLDNNKDFWRNVVAAEVELSVPRVLEGNVRGGYILKGQVDLVTGHGNEVEILDFKSGKVPGAHSSNMEKYQKQLNVYTYLLQQKGYNVKRASLFFTGVEQVRDNLISFSVVPENIIDTTNEFDDVVRNIEQRNFDSMASDKSECERCVFKRYCERVCLSR